MMQSTRSPKTPRKIITLVSKGRGKVGYKFLYQSPSPSCEGCERYLVCIKNLEEGRVYQIVNIRRKSFPCRINEEGVVVVEVVEGEVPAAIPKKLAIEGAVIPFSEMGCGELFCEGYNLCKPTGLKAGDHCKIVEVKGRVKCPQNLHLTEVSLQRLPSS